MYNLFKLYLVFATLLMVMVYYLLPTVGYMKPLRNKRNIILSNITSNRSQQSRSPERKENHYSNPIITNSTILNATITNSIQTLNMTLIPRTFNVLRKPFVYTMNESAINRLHNSDMTI